MEISSYASNIQPYGTPNGTNVANKNGNGIGTPSTASSTGDVSPQKRKAPSTTLCSSGNRDGGKPSGVKQRRT